MLKALVMPLLLLLPPAAGMFFPQLDFINHGPLGATKLFLVILIFFSALKVDPAQLAPQRAHVRLLAAQILLGVVAFYLVRILFPAQPLFAQTAFFTAIAPTAAVSSVVVGMLRGRVGFTLTGFLFSNVGVSLAMVGLLPLVTGRFSLSFLGNVAQTLTGLVGIPMVTAFVLKRFRPAARELPKRFGWLMKAVWIYALFASGVAARVALMAQQGSSWAEFGAAAGVSFLIIWVSLALGLSLSPRRLRSEGGHILWQKNTFFVIALALTYTDPIVILGPAIYTFWNNAFNGYLLYRDSRRVAARRKKQCF